MSWAQTRLKYLARRQDEVLPEQTDPQFGFKYVDISAVSQGRMDIPNEAITFGEAPSRARRLARPGDVAVSTVRTYLRAVAEVPQSDGTLVFSTAFAILRALPGVSERFLGYACQSDPFVEAVVSHSAGVSYPAITGTQLSRIALRHPDTIESQVAIAGYLDHETARIDDLIVEQEALLVVLSERRQAAIAEAVGVVDLPSSGQRLKHVVTSVRQGWSPQCDAIPGDGVSEWAVLKTGCVNRGIFRPAENKLLPADIDPRPETVVRANEVLICRASTRDLVGSAAVFQGDFPRLMLSDKLYALTVDRRLAEPEFVALRLGTRAVRDLIELAASGASHSMQNISQRDIMNLPMDLPPVDEQRAGLRVLHHRTSQIDDLTRESRDLIALLKERRAALITAAVTGKIDVRGQ